MGRMDEIKSILQLYVLYKGHTLDSEAQTGWDWKGGKKITMQK